jgi:hypothetical protein
MSPVYTGMTEAVTVSYAQRRAMRGKALGMTTRSFRKSFAIASYDLILKSVMKNTGPIGWRLKLRLPSTRSAPPGTETIVGGGRLCAFQSREFIRQALKMVFHHASKACSVTGN